MRPGLDFDSDHRILVTEMRTPKTRKARRKAREAAKKIQKPQPNLKTLRNKNMLEKYAEATQKIVSNSAPALNTEEMSNMLVHAMKTATEVLPILNNRKKSSEIWKDDREFNEIISERQNVEKTSLRYKELTSKLKRRINLLRNKKIREEADTINIMATKREVEDLYRSFKSDNSSFKKGKLTKKCQPEKLKEYFLNHFKHGPGEEEREWPGELRTAPDFIKHLRDLPEDIDTEPPAYEELKETINKLKNGKAANDVPATLIKIASQKNAFIKEMEVLYKEVWETLEVPTSWSHTKLVAIWKGASKGKAEDPTTYRGLQIGSSMAKILIIIIINRIKKWYENQLSDQQQGFRSGRGTCDGIFMIKRVQQITHKTKRSLYVLFIDLTAAFDKIDRRWLRKHSLLP